MAYSEIAAKDFKEFNKKNKIVLIDVSKKGQFDSGSIPNSVSIPYKVFKKKYETLLNGTKLPVYVTSNTGAHAKSRAKFLSKKGYNAIYIKGGSDSYALNYPLVRVIHQVIEEKK